MARAHFQLALSLLENGDLTSAVGELQTAVDLSHRGSNYLAYLGYTLAVMGNRAAAQEILNEVKALSRKQFVSPVDLAGILLGLDRKDAALALLKKAYDAHDPVVTRLVKDPRMASLRSDSRFQDLLRRVRLAP
jgi:tetratricopeptide (TPR) repeat protein